MRLTHFGGTALPTAGESDNAFDLVGRNALVVLRDGAFDQDGQPQVAQPFEITKSFKVKGATIDATVRTLAQLAYAGRRILKAVDRDGTTYYQTFAKVTKVTRPLTVEMQRYQEVAMTFLVDYPFWMATADEPHYFDNGDLLDGTWNLDGNYTSQSITSVPKAFTITQAGSAAARRGVIVFHPAAASSIVNPIIKNLTTNEQIMYVGTVAAGEYLTLDLLSKSTKIGWVTNAYSSMAKLPANQMDWLTLAVGANSIQVDASAIAGTIAFEWRWSKHFV